MDNSYFFGRRITDITQKKSRVVLTIESVILNPFDGAVSGVFTGRCFCQVVNDSEEEKWIWNVTRSHPNVVSPSLTVLAPGARVAISTTPGNANKWYSLNMELRDTQTDGSSPPAIPEPFLVSNIPPGLTESLYASFVPSGGRNVPVGVYRLFSSTAP
jgi:hypothetical protein